MMSIIRRNTCNLRIRHLCVVMSTLLLSCGESKDDVPPVTEDTQQQQQADTTTPPKLSIEEPPPLPILGGFCPKETPEKMQWPMDVTKVSLSIFHFNIQYVAGGLEDYLGSSATNEEIEDAIIVESFAPLVDLFERHPNWGASFEMQGYMLEVMALRHPDIATRFFELVRRGQVDLMSFHWSDQLVTAYTRADMNWSWAENQRVLKDLCLPLAPVHFLQEGQFGPGISSFATEKGGVVVLPRNLLKYHHDPVPEGLIHENDGHTVLVTNGYEGDGLTLHWNFVDDGELIATGDIPPYLFPLFKHSPEYLKENYEDKLQALEDDGYVIAPTSHYLKVVNDRQIARTVIDPPVLDGSWQPQESGNMFIWMGGDGQAAGDERDNALLTRNVIVRQKLRALESLLLIHEGSDIDTARLGKWHQYAVRQLLLAQVSDTTGWRPVITEINYGFTHLEKAEEIIQAIAEQLFDALDIPPDSGIDLLDGTTHDGPKPAPDPGVNRPEPADPLGNVVVDTERKHSTRWTSHGTDYLELAITIPAIEKEHKGAAKPPPVRLIVPMQHAKIVYSPALLEGVVRTFPTVNYQFAKAGDQFGLPLSNGLLGIGEKWTLVLDQKTIHLAANIEKDQVVFEDRTLPTHEPAEWRIRFYPKVADQVLIHANRLNIDPIVWF